MVVMCPKCHNVLIVNDDQEYAVCCGEVIYVMTDKEREIFSKELDNPSEPSEALKKAMLRYKKSIDETHNRKDEGKTDDPD